ncbi:MAG: hypothetical protein PHG19_09570 [Anaerotignum sp.]|nr:hypothetical protein [Anaerotignum sp.]
MERREMERLLRQQGRLEQVLREERAELRRLEGLVLDVSLPSGGGRSGGCGDPVCNEVIRRTAFEDEIQICKQKIKDMELIAIRLHRLMGEVLSEDERSLIRLRCYKLYRWPAITRKAAMSRSRCFTTYMGSLDKLCLAWDK